MYRLLTFPLNISFTLAISLIMSMIPLSYFYKTPEISSSMYVIVIILFFLIASLLIPSTPYYKKVNFDNDNSWKFFFWFSLIGFAIEFVLYGIPIFTPGGRDSYTGMPVIHVAFYSSAMVCVLMSSTYSSPKNAVICLAYASILSVITMSRQMMMICFAISLISFLSRNRLSAKKWFYILFFVSLVLFLFGVIGNIRQQLAGDYFDDYIITIGGANELGVSVGQSVYWIWLYISSPMYNLILNIENYYKFGDLCALNVYYGSCSGDYITSVIVPGIFNKYMSGNEFIDDLQVAYLNVSTAFASSSRILGLPGILIQCVLSILFYFIGLVLTPIRYRESFKIYFSVLSLYMCFDNKFIRTEFFFGFVLIFLCKLINSIKIGVTKKHLNHNG
ncbi:TPA: hypothetical protein JK844_003590 [Escherichia coli]|uniref:hypothetical protein n=1 Tax=Escherichia coli TaxID=562 RepID=UPI000DD8F0AC|nr:hypothetical protein [Escherichia coli]HAV7900303.1 hypothetical protein [Escherichia coli]